ncbi:MAG: hypothetical protein D3904_04975, partial [Candidatus Electrothrix sp. EH2]|nr:hypothetical protein [Candidatus Electrothrix sp. EH2]
PVLLVCLGWGGCLTLRNNPSLAGKREIVAQCIIIIIGLPVLPVHRVPVRGGYRCICTCDTEYPGQKKQYQQPNKQCTAAEKIMRSLNDKEHTDKMKQSV